MITKELVDYIAAARKSGMNDYNIRQNLNSGGGWTHQDIDEGLGHPESSVMPTPPPPTPSSPLPTVHFNAPKRTNWVVMVVVILLVLVSGATAYGFWAGYLPSMSSFFSKPPYAEGQLFSGILEKALTIDTVTYTFAGSLNTNPRESGATPLAVTEPSEQTQEAYQNDVTRVGDVQKILSGLQSQAMGYPSNGSVKSKTYLESLNALVSKMKIQSTSSYYLPNITDPNGNAYQYSRKPDGSGFTLAVNFETQEAVDQINNLYNTSDKKTLSVNGKTVTFNETSYTYTYIPSILPKPFIVTVTDLMKSAPATMSFSAGITGTYSRPLGPTPADWQATFDLAGDFDDLTINTNIEARRVGSDYYVILNKFPSILFLSIIGPIKGQWIKLTSKDTATSTNGYLNGGLVKGLGQQVSQTESSYKQTRAEAAADLRTLMRVADETKVLAFNNDPVREKLDGSDYYKYDLVLKKDNILAFLKALSLEKSKSSESSPLKSIETDKLIAYLERPENAATFDYISKNIFLTIWIDGAGMPAKGQFRLRIVPPATATHLAQKQVDFITAVTFKDINKPVHVAVPSKFITADEADDLLNNNSPLGDARKKGMDARVSSDVQQLRTQLEVDYDGSSYRKSFSAPNTFVKTGTYKALLDDAVAQGGKINVVAPATYTSYAIYGRLISSTSTYMCIDSTGKLSQNVKRNTAKVCP